jgi:DNA-directed RNA polymerase subunit RPC12/RpoP
MKTYKCEICEEEWEFFPKDYGYKKKTYPTRCPFCDSSILWTIKELRKPQDWSYLIKIIWKRIKYKK